MNRLRFWLCTLVMVALSVTISAQKTTLDEYNYVIRGYKTQLEREEDMKPGYKFVDLCEHHLKTGSVKRKCEFKALIRDGETKPCAIMCVFTRTDKKTTAYLCIPTYDADDDLWEQTYLDFTSYDGLGAQAMMWGLSKLAAYYAGQ
jgi:hypothetical protein